MGHIQTASRYNFDFFPVTIIFTRLAEDTCILECPYLHTQV